MTAAESTNEATGGLVEDRGQTWYRIDGVDRMDPFLTSVVSDVDLWMFVSSAGPLTAGRVDADHAFLPYETDDRLHRSVGVTGPVTFLAREVDGAREVWQPFASRLAEGCTRSLARSTLGSRLALEERNEGWGLDVRVEWAPAPRFGWTRAVELTDRSGAGAEIEVLDGLLDVMPTPVDAVTEQLRSNLVDAYKRAEKVPASTAAVYALESLITDRAEPAESLTATLLWSTGLAGAEVHLDEQVVDAMAAGEAHEPVDRLLGQRASYLVRATVAMAPGGSESWHTVADVGLGHAAVHDRLRVAGDPQAPARVAEDVAAGEDRLRGLLADADAMQATGDAIADAHHLSNVLYNVMRGGVFPYGYRIPSGDLVGFLADRNRDVQDRHGPTIRDRGAWIDLADLHALADSAHDPHLVRLVLEYLPLTFSRRHGDPSRPWNRFSIRVTSEDGGEQLAYEGNWRDIFQNWEALLRSYPRFFPHVVAKFVNASTLDGHNPYRLSRDGIDWEVPDPDDPWSNIGYWGDHQIVYLLRLLEGWQDVDAGGLARWLDRAVFTYADVPYRIADHEAMLADPRDTITYDEARAADVAARVDDVGADGRLVASDGDVVHVTLAEKLLVPPLAKLSSFVPGAGIWMNTQRPEWNDANNALAGYGASMVTLYHLERYLGFVGDHLGAGRGTHRLSRAVAAWLAAVTAALEGEAPDAADEHGRRRLLDALGRAGASHRAAVADRFDAATTDVSADAVTRLVDAAKAHLRASIRRARRQDGTYHAYNLIAFPSDQEVTVTHLGLMLEGQVAAATSPALDDREVVGLVTRLFDSPLYRPDQRSFMLYPADIPGSWLTRNTLPEDVVRDVPVLGELVGATGILREDAAGRWHFRPGLANVEALRAALDATSLRPDERAAVERVYEDLFDHHTFTGRSGGMYGYEGVGSIYWHMVSKLLLAVAERHARALTSGADAEVVDGLAAGYRRIRDGLGYRKDPATWGAIPLDCYSHTPAHAGAQQPGMTGQVKEEVLTRMAEIGLAIRGGRLRTVPPLLSRDELLGPDGASATVCAVPVRVVEASEDRVRVDRRDGTTSHRDGDALTRDESDAVFGRTGAVVRVEFARSVQRARR